MIMGRLSALLVIAALGALMEAEGVPAHTSGAVELGGLAQPHGLAREAFVIAMSLNLPIRLRRHRFLPSQISSNTQLYSPPIVWQSCENQDLRR